MNFLNIGCKHINIDFCLELIPRWNDMVKLRSHRAKKEYTVSLSNNLNAKRRKRQEIRRETGHFQISNCALLIPQHSGERKPWRKCSNTYTDAIDVWMSEILLMNFVWYLSIILFDRVYLFLKACKWTHRRCRRMMTNFCQNSLTHSIRSNKMSSVFCCRIWSMVRS